MMRTGFTAVVELKIVSPLLKMAKQQADKDLCVSKRLRPTGVCLVHASTHSA